MPDPDHGTRFGNHDSSDEAISWFRERFGDAARDLRVGERIEVGPQQASAADQRRSPDRPDPQQ